MIFFKLIPHQERVKKAEGDTDLLEKGFENTTLCNRQKKTKPKERQPENPSKAFRLLWKIEANHLRHIRTNSHLREWFYCIFSPPRKFQLFLRTTAKFAKRKKGDSNSLVGQSVFPFLKKWIKRKKNGSSRLVGNAGGEAKARQTQLALQSDNFRVILRFSERLSGAESKIVFLLRI